MGALVLAQVLGYLFEKLKKMHRAKAKGGGGGWGVFTINIYF